MLSIAFATQGRRLLVTTMVCAVVFSSHVRAQSTAATFIDPDGLYDDYYELLENSLAGAVATWGEYLSIHPDAVIDIDIAFDTISTATGGARGYSFLFEDESGVKVWEPHVAHEIRTGVEERPGEPDGKITIGLNYLMNEFWYDPDPNARTAEIPRFKIDAISTFTHELGHVLGFNGWHDPSTGAVAESASPFDLGVSVPDEQGVLYFHGANATVSYDGPVPLTVGNSVHYGNATGSPGDDLLGGLMNGVRGKRGERRWPGMLDYAILEDLGYSTTLDTYLEGDFNADGVVDAADFTLWQDNVGSAGLRLFGDGNLDRQVDADDYELWFANFGRESGGDALVAVALPEPSGSVVWWPVVLAIACLRRHRSMR